MNRLHQIAIGVDQLANAILAGWADETLSARSFRCGRKPNDKMRWRIAYRVINTIFFWQSDHCYEAYLTEKQRTHLAPEYRPEVA